MIKWPIFLFLLAAPLYGQVSNPSVVPVGTSPSGSCPAALPWQYNIVNGTSWYCGSVSGGTGTWAQFASSGGGGDTITSPNNTLNVGGTATATTLDVAGAAGKIMAGATPALTATPVLGASGTLGSVTMGNATSGTITVEPTTGALGTNTMYIPIPAASTDTLASIGNANNWAATQTAASTGGFAGFVQSNCVTATPGTLPFSFTGHTTTGMCYDGTYIGLSLGGQYELLLNTTQAYFSEPIKNGSAGTLSVPAIGMGNAATGMYVPSAGQVGLDCAGTACGTFTTTTTTLPNLTNADTGDYMCWNAGVVEYDATACLASLRKMKQNIQPLTDGLSEVMKLTPVQFHWKPQYNKDTRLQVGFIAEDVEKIDPRLAAYKDDGTLESVRYQQMTAVLAAAIQEQQKEIRALKRELTRLEKKH